MERGEGVGSDSEVARAIKFAIKSTDDLSLKGFGPRANAALDGLARELGRDVARALASREVGGSVYAGLASFWAENGLGEMDILAGRPTLIRLSKCYHCHANKGDDPRPTCAFKRSLLRSALEGSVPNLEGLSETRCCRAGGEYCTFSVLEGRSGGAPASVPFSAVVGALASAIAPTSRRQRGLWK